MLARKVHQAGYKVALTGEGADEWLAGYPWYKIHRLLGTLDVIPGLKLSRYARAAYLRLTGAPKVSWETLRRVQEAIGGDSAWLNIYGLFGSSKSRFFSQSMWEQLGDHLPYADLQLNTARASKWHPLNRSLYLGARVMLPGLLLASKGDRVAMNSSVETRYPFLDEDVFAFLAKLDPGWKMRGLRDKLILRYLADRWVPRSIAWRRKAMFRAPLDGFHTQTLPTFVDQLLSPESLKKTGYFDPSATTHWRNAFRTMRPGSNQRTMVEMGLVGVVATQLWHHTYIDGTLADLPSSCQLPVVSSQTTSRQLTAALTTEN
jgi:asparagine synthase (glutamine-hydrolysing)